MGGTDQLSAIQSQIQAMFLQSISLAAGHATKQAIACQRAELGVRFNSSLLKLSYAWPFLCAIGGSHDSLLHCLIYQGPLHAINKQPSNIPSVQIRNQYAELDIISLCP